MSLSVGIVGLPNVGKSTLFNALTKREQAAAENYPFCTIEPNTAIVEVEDARLDRLAEIVSPQQIVKATVNFTDIAGLVKGASKGEGLGNKFLANIRESDAILHVVRCFEDNDIIHVQEGGNKPAPVDPVSDAEIIETELVLADYEQLCKRMDKLAREARANPKLRPEAEACEGLKLHLEAGNPVRTFPRSEGDPILEVLRELNFLTDKPVIYCANVGEDDVTGESNPHVQALKSFVERQGCDMVVVSAKIEADLAGLSDAESAEFLESYGLRESGLTRTIRLAYHTLGLASYFTAGPKEVKAWTFRRGWTAPKCAGVIHTDFERGFIRAEVISYDDYIAHHGEQGAKAAGVMRVEGKDYLVQDGDVMHFLFNV
ncbi:MAG: redox-regulated ATPase YchF [Kiritimatiellae bacterium]|nr:redox-regulated ATPase YchF [Kiritimatiellia bacterium]